MWQRRPKYFPQWFRNFPSVNLHFITVEGFVDSSDMVSGAIYPTNLHLLDGFRECIWSHLLGYPACCHSVFSPCTTTVSQGKEVCTSLPRLLPTENPKVKKIWYTKFILQTHRQDTGNMWITQWYFIFHKKKKILISLGISNIQNPK